MTRRNRIALNHYLIGNKVVMLGSCALIDPITGVHTPTDPTTVKFIREMADEIQHEYNFGVDANVVKLAAGVFACTVSLTQAGREKWRYETTGACEAAAEDAFIVDASML